MLPLLQGQATMIVAGPKWVTRAVRTVTSPKYTFMIRAARVRLGPVSLGAPHRFWIGYPTRYTRPNSNID